MEGAGVTPAPGPTMEGRIRTPAPGEDPLVVEDEHLVALDIKLRLEKMGHRAVVAYSGEEAVDAAAAQFDLVLMDIKLRGVIDGIEAARQIRSSSDVAVIYLTAYADDHTLERARTTEPYGYLLKPFEERELHAAIEMALQRHDNDKARWEQQQVQRFLADASARMAATLDYRALARSAAELVVPRYADWCAIHLDESADSIPGSTYTYPDGDRERVVSHRIGVIESVERTAHSQILPRITDDAELVEALGGDDIDMLRVLGARSVLCVPLVARGQVLGALALVSGRGRARYSTVDLAFFEDFGQRLGMALDNALLYRKSERAIQMRDDVLAIVSHDLRTPLSTISMLADMLSDHTEMHKTGASIARAAKRMTRLIGDLLDASAINAGRLSLAFKAEPGAAIVREVCEMFRPKAEAHGIALVEEAPR